MESSHRYSQVIEVRGHIIDSMILPKILDEIIGLGADFEILRLEVGKRNSDPSYAQIEVSASSEQLLQSALREAQIHGAVPLREAEASLEPAPADGVFPLDFYSTTNLETWIYLDGQWKPVAHPEMDCGILVENGRARTIPLNEVRKGQMLVVGRRGIRVIPLERSRAPSPIFGFMGSAVSSEKPKSVIINEVGSWMRSARQRGGKILVVAGPAVVHTGSRDHLSRLIEMGYVNYLFAGNALATHDIEASLFGTSLGVPLAGGQPLESGHEHHLRAINRIRAEGGIKQAVQNGVLTKGIMYSCVQYGVDFVLAGSIRDDGPLPDVITDVLQAQAAMRSRIQQGVEVALMMSTMLHSIAVGNMLPASVLTACVDVNPATLTKLVDRGSFQSVGLVMDVGGFLRELIDVLSA